jgi:hypothetical protein
MTQFLFTTCGLAVVVVGILIMTQVLSLEELGSGMWRAFVFLALAFVMVWVLRTVLLPILICVLVWLKSVMLWAVVIVLATIAFMIMLRVLPLKLAKRAPQDKNHKEEL